MAETLEKPLQGRHYAVVVLGDLGRSPRMQYHTLSFVKEGATVSFVGQEGENCIDAVEQNSNINIIRMQRRCSPRSRRCFVLYAPFKVLFQILQLFWVICFSIRRPDAVLVQNPPSIPVLAVVSFVCWLRRSRMLIDWHNFGYTILALSLPPKHPFVVVSRWYERFFARRAHGHFCVTEAMKNWLQTHWGIRATVLYDKAPDFFKPCSTNEKHELFMRLKDELQTTATSSEHGPQTTVFTTKQGETAVENERRPALLVSSTSWTPDEDFNILWQALTLYDERASSAPAGRYPDIFLVVTGKGPMKAHFEEVFQKSSLRKVTARTAWLEPSDYPKILGSADLGISLHTSSSGLDLPMKVVDMFGAGLPVCAVGFRCLNELVKHKKNGMIFDNPNQLADQLMQLLKGFPTDAIDLKRLRQGVMASKRVQWHDNWRLHALPLVKNT